MKKFLMLLLCAMLMFSFVACDDETPTPTEVEKVKVTLVYGNGATDKVETVEKGSEYTLPAAPENAGYAFDGWFVGEKSYAAGDKVKVEADTTFTAKWSIAYLHEFTVNTVDELIERLNNLEDSTVITLKAGTYDFEGKSTDVEYYGQTGWMIPVLKNNVCIKAEEGAVVEIKSTDDISNGAAATQTIFAIDGDNFILDGIKVGERGSKNKTIQMEAENTVIRNCSFAGKSGVYISSKQTKNTTIENCTFDATGYVSFTDGASGLNLIGNKFGADTIIYLTGKRESGWNPNSIDLSSVEIKDNTFDEGATVEMKATAEDWTCFDGFDPVTLFGMTKVAEECKDPSEATYNAKVEVYKK